MILEEDKLRLVKLKESEISKIVEVLVIERDAGVCSFDFQSLINKLVRGKIIE